MSKWIIWVVLTAGLAACGDEVSTTAGAGGQGGGATAGSGGQATATTGGGGQGPMGASAACQACVADVYSNDAACGAAIQVCDGDTACNDWKNCGEDCFNGNDVPACYAACDAEFPHDTSLSEPVIACTCDACSATCIASCS